MENEDVINVKTLHELEKLVAKIGTSIILVKDFNLTTKYYTNFRIDIFSLKDNIFTEIIEIEKLPTTLKEYKIRQLQSLNNRLIEYSKLFEGIANNSENPDNVMVVSSLHLLGAWVLIRDNLKLLKKELENNANTEPEKETNKSELNENPHPKPLNKFPEIFHPGGYELFCYLNENYKGDNNSPVTKYSNLFRFLKYENKTLCTNEKYVAFIKSEYELKLSKILPETLKYTDKTQSVLTQIRINFEAQLRK